MQFLGKPKGYVNNRPEHIDPVQSPPPPKLIEQKEEETLMGGAMKAFVKERLYGNMINFNKRVYNKSSNFTPTSQAYSMRSQSRQSSPAMNELVKLQIKEIRQKPYNYHLKQSQATSENPQLYSNTSKSRNIYNNALAQLQKQRYKRSSSMLDHSQSHQNQQQIKQQSRLKQYKTFNLKEDNIIQSNLYRQKKLIKNIHHHPYLQDRYDNMQSYQGNSFISAVEDIYEGKVDNKKNYNNNQIKLKPINRKSTNKSNDIQRLKTNLGISMSIKHNNIKIQQEKFNINQIIWESFCITKRSKIVQTLLDASSDKSTSLLKTLLQGNSYKSLTPSLIPDMPILFTPDKNKLKISQNDKQKGSKANLSFNRQFFLTYINSSKDNYTQLSNFYYQFYQIGNKIYQDMKQQDYKKTIEIMVSANMRIWMISAFKFWDLNNDGVICSKDIFAMYTKLDQMQDKYRLQNNSQYNKQRGFLMIIKLKNILQNLRSVLFQLKLQSQLAKKSKYNPISKRNQFDIKYLQEALIKKNNLKYSDLILILGQSTKSKNNDSVIQINKQSNLKFSSCYRYSFLATDHNEQTRQDRDHIENLKVMLKKEKMELQQIRQTDVEMYSQKLPVIDYGLVVQRNLFGQMREIVLDIFGVQMQ